MAEKFIIWTITNFIYGFCFFTLDCDLALVRDNV